jgi:DNA-binding LacI/PurR family transcriptional regulator
MEAPPQLQAQTHIAEKNILLATQENYLLDSNGEHFHIRLIRSFERLFSKSRFNLLFKSVERGADFLEVIRQTRPAAIILDSYNQEAVYQEAARSGIPRVSVNHYTPLITSVVSNNFDGAYQAAKLLTDAGHRRIAYVTGKRNYQTTIERLSGVQRLYMQLGVPLDPKYVFTGNWQFPSGVEAAEQILAMPAADRPTAVFAFNDDMSYGCLSCFEKHGLFVPGDISLVGFDNSDRFQSAFRPITTVDVNIDALVEYTYWYLSGRLSGSAPATNARIDIDAAIVDNGTVRTI